MEKDPPAEKAPQATFRVGTDLVLLNVSVFDAGGQVLEGLSQDAFTVCENGVRQEIRLFQREDVPVSLGLIVDNSGSMETKRRRVISAALAMIQASNPDDEVFAIYFNRTPELVQEFTGDIGLLERSLRRVRPLGETAMRDAVLMGIDHMRERAARDKRVLVVITDGEDNASLTTRESLTEAARENNVMIYAIGLLSEEAPASAAAARDALEELTEETGGRGWFPASVGAVAAIAPEIAHEIRSQYVIGYRPTDLTKDGKFRTITVEVNVRGASVRTRPGYYARP
jgi:VWFA-related protein